jgi:hypothetical protein
MADGKVIPNKASSPKGVAIRTPARIFELVLPNAGVPFPLSLKIKQEVFFCLPILATSCGNFVITLRVPTTQAAH